MKHKYGMFYSAFLKALRMEKSVTLEQLGWGLCSISMMNRIEEGRRLPEKLMRDRLMDRLGVANDGFEDYLQPDEYIHWKNRQDLIHAIECSQLDRAERIICQYEENNRGRNSIEYQFYLAMKVQIMRRREASDEEMRAVLKCAIELTMPECHMDGWRGHFLAVQEWNLLLEYIGCGGDMEQLSESGREGNYRVTAYESLLEAIRESKMDIYSCAKIYPKASYFLCLELMKKPEEDWDCERLLQISGNAVEILRDAERMYYLSELLEVEEKALVLLLEKFKMVAGGIGGLLSALAQVRKWREVLTEVYQDGNVSEKMENDCFLYWQTQNYCYGDVVRKRREMLGMSAEELCAGICEKRTLHRLESKKCHTQIEIIGELFERLGLSCEYVRKNIVTDRYEAISLYNEALDALINRRDTEALSRILPQLREMLPMDLAINRQQMDFFDMLYLYYLGNIKKEECLDKLKKILEYTVPLRCIKQEKENCLSNGEMQYLCNLATKSEGQEKKMYMSMLLSVCRQLVKENGIKAYINTYETFMCNIASYLGDEGDYAQSNEISDEVMRECLSMRRMNMLYNCVYNRWWNQREGSAVKTSTEQKIYTKHELQKCIQLAGLCKSTAYVKFYTKKLNSMEL